MKNLFVKSVFCLLFICGPAFWAFSDSKTYKGEDYQVTIDGDKLVFTLKKAGQTASVPGYFNSWNPKDENSQMALKDGVFQYSIPIAKFVEKKPLEFKFYVDGNWDQGNNKALSMIEKKGEWWFVESPVDKVKSNTPLNTSIMFSGRFTSWIPFRQDVKNNTWNPDGDDGFYLTDSEHNLDLDINYKIGGSVLGLARLKVNYRDNTDRRMWLDSLNTFFISDDIKINTFYRNRNKDLNFDDPLQSLRKFVSTDFTGISFTGIKDKHDLYDFGRDFGGMGFKFDPVFNMQLLLARKIVNSAGIKQDVIAARIKPIDTKILTIGATWLYNANHVFDDEYQTEINNGGKYVNPLSVNYLTRPFNIQNTTNFAASTITANFNHEIGADITAKIGPIMGYAQFKYFRSQYDVFRTEGEVTYKDNNMIFGAGMVFSSGSLVAEVSFIKHSLDEVYLSKTNTRDTLSLDASYFTIKAKYSFSAKSYAAASFIMKAPSVGDSLWEQRAEARFETDYFDLWAFQSFRNLQGRLDDYVYKYIELRAGLDWYFSAKFTATVGVRFMNDLLEDPVLRPSGYYSIVPLIGVKYKFNDNITARLYYGADLDYTAYLEDNGRTIDSRIDWANAGTQSLLSSRNEEKKLMNMPTITFLADVKF